MKGLDMADILKQLMQLNMQNRAGRSPSGRGQIGGTDFASIAKLLAGRGVTPDGIRPPPQVTDPNTTINASPDPIITPYDPTPIDASIDPVPPMPISPLGEIEQAREAQRSYNLDANGNQTEIGYDGQPISSYTPEQMSIHNAIKGVTPSQSRYVFNGEGYDLVPYEPQYPDYQPPVDYTPLPNPSPQYPQHPEESTRRPIDFYNPSPPMDFPEDPGILQPTEPVYNPDSKRGGDMKQIFEEAMRAYRDQQNFEPQPNPYDQYRD